MLEKTLRDFRIGRKTDHLEPGEVDPLIGAIEKRLAALITDLENDAPSKSAA